MGASADKPPQDEAARIVFDDRIVRNFVWAALVWGALSLALGLILAASLCGFQIADAAGLSFGRLQPVHRSVALYAFVGNLMYAGAYYACQRLFAARVSMVLSRLHFILWQLAVAGGVFTLFRGLSQGVPHAEFVWPIDAAVLFAAVLFAAGLVHLVARRRVLRIPLAAWFFLAGALLFPLAYVFGNLAIPTGLGSSVRYWSGAKDALVAGWFADQSFAYLALAPALGLAYFLMPRLSGRALYSHRLAVLHFWSFLLLASFAGASHLLGSALPAPAQATVAVFTIVLWIPSAAVVINGVGTLWSADGEHRASPAHTFLLASVLCYAVFALETPLHALGSFSAVAHLSDWMVGHRQLALVGTVGWIGAAGLYYMVPRLYGRGLRSPRVAQVHLRVAILGLILTVASTWLAGATAGTMWRAESPYGGFVYSFVESLDALHLLRMVRLAGECMLALGFGLMLWNVLATASGASLVAESTERKSREGRRARLVETLLATPVLLTIAVVLVLAFAFAAEPIPAATGMFLALVLATLGLSIGGDLARPWHGLVERRGLALGTLIVGCAALGMWLTLAPTLGATEKAPAKYQPLSALELAGKRIYEREGCTNCHTQMIRSYPWEVERYGAASRSAESVFDRPAQWGSRRVGPDLAREGGKRDDAWHATHLLNPQSVMPSSVMPSYAYLASEQVDLDELPGRMRGLAQLGVPYSKSQYDSAAQDARRHAAAIATRVDATGVSAESELVALIAYLQRLGLEASPHQGGEP